MANNKESILITQVKSLIAKTKNQKRTIKALGLGRINNSVTKKSSPELMGMIKVVEHLVTIKKL